MDETEVVISSPQGGTESIDLALSTPKESDLPDILEFFNRPTIMTTALSRDALSVDRIQAIVSLQGQVDSEGQIIPGVVGAQYNGQWAFLFFITAVERFCDTYSLAAVFDNHYSREILRHSIQLVLKYLFEEVVAHRVEVYVFEQSDSDIGLLSILQESYFCFEGIKRSVLKNSTQSAEQSAWIDVMCYSLLTDEWKEFQRCKEMVSETLTSPSEGAQEKLLKKAEYEGIESVILRAVIMKKRQEIVQQEQPDSGAPEDLCLLLFKRKADSAMRSTEELPGIELKTGSDTIQTAFDRLITEDLGSSIKTQPFYLTSFDFIKEDGRRAREFVFRVDVEEPIRCPFEEYVSFQWVPLQNLVKTPLHPEVMTILFSCKENINYVSETHSVKDEELILEEVRSPLSTLYESLVHGLHVHAYAARGFGAQDMIGLSLQDRAGHLIGGLLAESQYGGYICQKLWIDPQFWGQGWEKRLIDRVEYLAKENSAHFIVFLQMDWEILRPLQQSGYRIEWQRSGYDRGSKLLYLRKDLS